MNWINCKISLPVQSGYYWVSVSDKHNCLTSILYLDDKLTYACPTEWDDENRKKVIEYISRWNDFFWMGPICIPDSPLSYIEIPPERLAILDD